MWQIPNEPFVSWYRSSPELNLFPPSFTVVEGTSASHWLCFLQVFSLPHPLTIILIQTAPSGWHGNMSTSLKLIVRGGKRSGSCQHRFIITENQSSSSLTSTPLFSLSSAVLLPSQTMVATSKVTNSSLPHLEESRLTYFRSFTCTACCMSFSM